MIALLCATLLCLAAADVRWQFTMYVYGRDIVIDGMASERECRMTKERMRLVYPDATMSDCEESR